MHSLVALAALLCFTVANLSTCYLYLYPSAHRCAFPLQPAFNSSPSQTAPFRLLVFGDPQLEGDSSLLKPEYGLRASLHDFWHDVTAAKSARERVQLTQSRLRDLMTERAPKVLQSYRKRLDLLGNDFYLAHIYRSLHWSVDPTHVTVVGDLIGSQWVSDEEFERRGWRYWQRVFLGGQKVEDEKLGAMFVEPLGQGNAWKNRVINVVGNHDIGYAGDITAERLQRFEKVFGRANWETRFHLPETSGARTAEPPELKIVVLNSLNMDPPALDYDLQSDTYKFINSVIDASRSVEDQTSATILLTHLPLHKDAGTCVDGPYFAYHESQRGGGIREQNHLSSDATKTILESIYGMSGSPDAPGKGLGRNGIILTGHDHEGCDVYHHLPESDDPAARSWTAEKWNATSTTRHQNLPGIREITVRSMMGDFGGNAGLLSAWFDSDLREWQFAYSTCALGTQHIWWATHIFDMFTVCLVAYVVWNLVREPDAGVDRVDGKEKTL